MLWKGEPVVVLDPRRADRESATHEMGHAIFEVLQNQGASDAPNASAAQSFRLKIADIYLRLSVTKKTAAGIRMTDPTQWARGMKGPLSHRPEHPRENPDEFFASAMTAFTINKKGFIAAIQRAVKEDSAVKAPADELLKLLGQVTDVQQKTTHAPPKETPEAERQKTTDAKQETDIPAEDEPSAAEGALKGIPATHTIEEESSIFLNWLIHPDARPERDSIGSKR